MPTAHSSSDGGGENMLIKKQPGERVVQIKEKEKRPTLRRENKRMFSVFFSFYQRDVAKQS